MQVKMKIKEFEFVYSSVKKAKSLGIYCSFRIMNQRTENIYQLPKIMRRYIGCHANLNMSITDEHNEYTRVDKALALKK